MLSRLSRSARVASLRQHGRSFAAGKEILFADDARNKMLLGVNKITDAVQITLGPKGRNVIIENSWGSPSITKDGVTVAKAIDLPDRFENMGAQLLKQVASKTNDTAGDGTTTSTILARAIFREGCKGVAAGMNPEDMRRGINKAAAAVIKVLKSQAKPVDGSEHIEQVATISANGDKTIGSLIARGMERVGRDGVLTVETGKIVEDELEVVEGMQFSRGFISPYFMTHAKSQQTAFDAPHILLVEGKVTNFQDVLPAIEISAKSGKALVIIAEDVSGEALNSLIINRIKLGLKVVAIKAPGFGDNRKANLQDIAVLTGATIVREEIGLKLSDVNPEHLGSSTRIEICKDNTLIVGGAGTKEAVDERVALIRSEMENSSSPYETDKYQGRLAKLAGGIAVLKVGGASDVEVGEKKDRVDDALCATRAAVEEGIVPGGGVALLYASQCLDELVVDNDCQTFGVDIVRRALQVPIKTICQNAGLEGSVFAGRLLEDAKGAMLTKGVDASNGEYVDMFEAGIIDPAKVVRVALEDAVSVASVLTTAECAIVNIAQPEPLGPPAGAGGGIPGLM